MKYDHRVKVGGKWFDAGVEVDVKLSTPVKPENTTDKVEPKKEEPTVEPEFTRSQIQQMNSSDLRVTASKLDIEFGEDVTNKELKQMIFSKLGL